MHTSAQNLNAIHCFNNCWLSMILYQRPCQHLGMQRLMRLDLCSHIDLDLLWEVYNQKFHNYNASFNKYLLMNIFCGSHHDACCEYNDN